jgi:simple sugar transport system substrate-binding protein
MLQAVETAKAADGGKVLFIDVIGDKTAISKGFLLSSVVWDITPVYSAMIKDLKDDTFGTKRYAIGLADDSVKLLKTDQIPDNVWGEVQKIREQMISGEIKIEPVFEATAVRALMTDVSATAQ